jgi:hypothetical protein
VRPTDPPAPIAGDVFDELRQLMPEAVARALVERLRGRPTGTGALHWELQRGEWRDAWFDRIHISLDSKRKPGAQ